METGISVNEKPSIPLDVIETIIGILATVDDRELSSVKACSLTCRSFLHFCRKHIFASLSFDEIPKGDYQRPYPTSSDIQTLLTTVPEIANYVRKLSFGLPNRIDKPNVSLDLSEVLKGFKQVHHLSVNSGRTDLVVHWTDLADCIQDAVLHLLNLPTIDYLRLSNLSHFPILELNRCINLRYLHFAFFEDPVLEYISPMLQPRSTVVLEEYSMGWGVFDGIENMITSEWPNGQPLFDFRDLKKYSASWDTTDTGATELTRQILKNNNQLASLDLYCDFEDLPLSGFSNTIFHSLKSLRRIVLRFPFHSTWDRLNGLPNELKVIREWPNVLEELDIRIHPLTYSSMFNVTEEEWGSDLDESLNDSGWSSLKEVSIVVQIPKKISETYHQGGGIDFDTAIRQVHQTQSPLLSSSKAIIFNFTIFVPE